MATASLTIDLDAIAANWRALDRMSSSATQTAAVVKADAYGLGMTRVARTLAQAGARRFFVAATEEGAALRQILGPGPEINILSGHMAGDTDMIADLDLVPMLNSLDQITRHFEALPGRPFGIQLDTGMNRLGMEPDDWAAVAQIVLDAGPQLLMSHLACSDAPNAALNAQQLATFHALTDGLGIPRSLSATGGILLGKDYHFELTRPGIGAYGGAPWADALPVVGLSLPVIQTRMVEAGEYVGYSMGFQATRPTHVATLAAGYADGISRATAQKGKLWHGDQPCPILGRISMDMIAVDITHLTETPTALDLIGPHQGVDAVGAFSGTIGYEVLTSLGGRYNRRYLSGQRG